MDFFLNKHFLIQVTRSALAALLVWFSTSNAQVLPFQEAKERADKGDAFAQAVVAMHYQIGWETETNLEQAAKYATTSANARHALGFFRVGTMLRNGEGFTKDEKKGLEFQAASYNALKDAKDPYSITATAIMIFQGKVVGQNLSDDKRRRIVASLYKQAADMGYAPAQYNYAMCAGSGYGLAQNSSLKEKYMVLAAALNYPQALQATKQSLEMNASQSRSFVKGVHRDEEWFYGFVEDSESKDEGNLACQKLAGRPVYSDDEWIVTKLLCPSGTGFASSLLRFYDARSLILKHAVSVPNDVFHLDRSTVRKHFLLLTSCGYQNETSCLPHDLDQALVLIDLDANVIEKIRLWKEEEYHLQWNGECAPKWEGDTIIIPLPFGGTDVTGKERLPNLSAKAMSREFNNVSLKFSEEANEYQFIPSIKRLDHRSLEFTGINSSDVSLSESQKNKNSSMATVGAVHDDGLMADVLVRFENGFLDHLNLSTLQSETRRTTARSLVGLGLLHSGVTWLLSNDMLTLVGPSSEIGVDLPAVMNAPRAVDSDMGYGTRPRVYSPRAGERSSDGNRRDNMQLDADSDAVYISRYDDSKVVAKKISASGDVDNVAVRMPREIGSRPDDFILDARRSSIAFLLQNSNSEFFRVDVDWSTGELKNQDIAWEAATPELLSVSDVFHGKAPSGWILFSALSGTSKWGARSDHLRATELASGRIFSISDGPQRHKQPLVFELNKARDFAIAISSGDAAARVEKLDLSTGKVIRLREWEWPPNLGSPLYEELNKRLWIPSESGYTIYRLGKDGRLEELFLLGEFIMGDPGDYAILLPNGIYAGSPGCESLLRLKAGDGLVDGSSVSPWRNRPADVLKALGGDTEQIEILAKMTERWLKRIGHDSNKPEPKASELPTIFVPERPPLWAQNQEAGFAIQWQHGASPLKNVIVRVNGVESARFAGDALTGIGENKGTVEAKIKLAQGQNWIEVTAEDIEGRRSDLQRFRTILKDAPTQSKRYVVALGVSEYAKPELNLQFAAKDAKDLSAAISGQKSNQTLLLSNHEVNLAALQQIRSFVGQASENDEVVVFCAGHGVLGDNLDYYFAGHDFDPQQVEKTGIKLDDLVDAISASKALKRLILLDTCHAGVVGEKDEMLLAQMDNKLPSGVRAVAQRGMKVQQAIDFSAASKQRFIEEMFSLPGTIRGVNIIGASAGAQFALESEKWSNGVFTAAVIEGLRDKKADWNTDDRITVSELKNYLGQRVSELTAGAQKPSVVAFEQDQDFNLIR
jgi:TPR repeat protein